MQFEVLWRYRDDFLSGLWGTLTLSLEIILLGTVLALLVLPLRISSRAPFRWLGWLLLNPFRILPALVLLVWGFYSLPSMGRFQPSAWTVAVWALGLNMAGFCVEIFRSAVEEVPAEHVEAAQLLGMSRREVGVRIIAPLAWRNALVPYLNQVLQTTKLTVLAALISVRELYHVAADFIQQTNLPIEGYTMLAILTFIPLLLLTAATEWIERSRGKIRRDRRWRWVQS
jgi:polar amino acid transport system permease protein